MKFAASVFLGLACLLTSISASAQVLWVFDGLAWQTTPDMFAMGIYSARLNPGCTQLHSLWASPRGGGIGGDRA